MANYSDLGLKRDTQVSTMKWGNKEIKIKKYLPIEAKYDIVMITLQQSMEDGFYNPIKLDMHYHLNLLYMYSDLNFTDEEKENSDKIYDEIKSTGFLDEFLKYVNENEYVEMEEDIELIAELMRQEQASVTSVIKKLIDDLPANAEAAQKIVDNFNPEKYQAVVDFAKAANGGRDLPK